MSLVKKHIKKLNNHHCACLAEASSWRRQKSSYALSELRGTRGIKLDVPTSTFCASKAVVISILQSWLAKVFPMERFTTTKRWLVGFAILMFTFSLNAFAYKNTNDDTVFEEYFTYVKVKEINVRIGPNKRYPVKWVIKSVGEPLRVHAKFSEWFRISDVDGEGGWVLANMTSKEFKHAIIKKQKFTYLKQLPADNSASALRLEKGVRVRVKKCNKHNWCKVRIANTEGWLKSTDLWGL